MTKALARRSTRAAPALPAAAATATSAVLATWGTAKSAPTTLHLVGSWSSQNGLGFGPPGAPAPGDSVGFADKLSGDDRGTDRIICTIVGGAGGAPCTVWVKLSHCTLTAQDLLPQQATRPPLATMAATTVRAAPLA